MLDMLNTFNIIIGLGVVVVVSLLLLVITIICNKFSLAIIKIEKAEEDIDMYLQKKKELLDRTKPIVMKELKLEEFLPELNIPLEEVNNFETNNILKQCSSELNKIIDDNEKLLKSEALVSILDSLTDNEEDIIGAIKFYNDTVVNFNKLVVSFPSNVIALFKRYKKKDFYSDEKKEMYEILKDK